MDYKFSFKIISQLQDPYIHSLPLEIDKTEIKLESNDSMGFLYRYIYSTNRQELTQLQRRQPGIQEQNIKLDASPMVLHCLCFFMSLILTYFFIIIGLLFHFCPCMMFSAKQSDGTHVSSFKKMKSLQDSSANFSCPAFYDALSSLSLFHSKNVTKNCS